MPFPRRLLTEDEEVVVELRPHWAFLGRPLALAVAVVVLVIVVAVQLSNAPVGVLYVMLALVTGSALWLAGRLVRWFASSFVVTNTRIIQRTGVFGASGARAPVGAGQPAVVPPVHPGPDPADR